MSKQEQMLVMVYKGMSTAEIEQRVASGELIPLAMGVAENELQQRRARGGSDQPSLREKIAGQAARPPRFVELPPVILGQIVLAILAMVVTALLMPGVAPFVWPVAILMIANYIGKAFPLFGKIVGWPLLLSPLAILGAAIYFHQTKNWGPVEVFLTYLLSIIYCFVMGLVGLALLKGARDTRAWETLGKEWEEARRKALEAGRR